MNLLLSRAATPARFVLLALALAGSLVAAKAARADDKATGDWGGARGRLSAAGMDVEIDYTAESFSYDDSGHFSGLGDLDVMFTFDTAKLGAWQGGQVFVFAQDNHSGGVGSRSNLLMPLSNLDASPFTQLSEFWLLQQVGPWLSVRLGKQDANRDFAGPRFAGNFVNSSFGVLPGAPLPSFPAPALGVAAFVDPTSWFGVRAGVYEGDPRVEAFGSTAFRKDSGVFAIGALLLRHALFGRDNAGIASVGGWTHTGVDRSGVYGIYDLRIFANPKDQGDQRSFQVFVRGGWSPEDRTDVGLYVGGGITAHGFLGINNTIGIGTGYVETAAAHEAFVELFYKWRPLPWFTVEPDVQVYDTAGANPVYFGMRVKLKL